MEGRPGEPALRGDHRRGNQDKGFPSKSIWAVQGSNLRPSACKTDALPLS